MNIKGAPIKIKTLSKKQTKVMTWWVPGSPYADCNGIVADGAIRSGKTLIMALSFVIWGMEMFNGQLFGMSGKSVGAFRRNVVIWIKPMLRMRGYRVVDLKSDNVLEVSRGNKVNYFYIFGARDERAQDFVQGMTAAGFFFDEVVLQPESFVEQATGRCSVEGSKWWFNCNPDKPNHWFKIEWLDKAKEKGLYHLHFTLDDNPGLSTKMKERYRAMYSGVFFLRHILGLWVLAEGIIYDNVTEENFYEEGELKDEHKWRCTRHISVDYGTVNPMVYLDIFSDGRTIYVDDEYCYDSSKEGKQKTDGEYGEELKRFIDKEKLPIPVERVVIDPSAASFKLVVRQMGYVPKDANNEVLEGIRLTSSGFHRRIIKINKRCKNLMDELNSYSWDEKAKDRGVEQPIKQDDHSCVVGHTLIETVNGKQPIKELVGKTGKLFCINTKTKRKVVGNFSDVRKTGENKDCYRITLSNGKIIEATAEHRIFTDRGWKRLIGTNQSVYKIDVNSEKAGLYMDIESIEYIGKHDVYNMEVEKYRNYAVDGGTILHNCDSLRYYTYTIAKRWLQGRG